MNNVDRKFRLIRFKWNNHVYVFVWTWPSFWMWLAAVFLVRDIHFMFQGRYVHLMFVSALIWSVLASLQRNKLYGPIVQADEDASKLERGEKL